jgi:Big-like domain-containing protein/List-Bact-rpt repeat protein
VVTFRGRSLRRAASLRRIGPGMVALAALTVIGCTAKDSSGGNALYQVNVSGLGGGSGTITGSTGDLACTIAGGSKSGTCLAQYAAGSSITLTAVATSGSVFSGWSGACLGTAATCQLTVNATANVQASFAAAPEPLTVSGSGSGTGSVTSAPAAIACTVNAGATTGACNADFAAGTAVTLTATATGESSFAGWSGDCTGSLPGCTLTANAAHTAQVRFLAQRSITVAAAGAGSGSVSSSPEGIACAAVAGTTSGTCLASYVDGSSVTLTAAPLAGSSFVGWSGACTTVALVCTVTASSPLTATANFAPLHTLAVTGSGAGAGTVSSSPGGIACSLGAGVASGACSAPFADATAVTLTALASAGSSFGGWGGSCSGSGSCVISMTSDRALSATFIGASSVANTSVTIAPGTLIAGGGAATVTITVRDASNAPVAGAAVTLAVASGPAMTITQPVGLTAANGTVTGSVASTVAGARTIAATIGGAVTVAQQPTITVTAGAPSGTASTLALSPASIAAGSNGSTVTATVRDGFGNAVSGATVALAVSSGTAMTVTGPVGVTGANGSAVGNVQSTVAGVRTISGLINGNIAIVAQPLVTVNAAAPATVAASGAFSTTGARFGQGVPVLPAVLITDAFGNPVGGASVTFSVTHGLAVLGNGSGIGTAVQVMTDASGVARPTSWVLTSVATAGNYDGTIDVNNTVTAIAAALPGNPVAFSTAVTVSYDNDVQAIWNGGGSGSCTSAGCHASGGNAPVLTIGTSRSTLMANPAYWSSGDSTTISSSTNRLLYRLTTGGPVMPSGFAQLPPNIVSIIKAYIKQGVPNN